MAQAKPQSYSPFEDGVPSKIVVYADSDDEREPQVAAPEPQRGRDRALSQGGSLKQPVFGSDKARQSYHTAPAAAPREPRRPPGIHRRGLPQVTTLEVRNVPTLTSQQQFLDEVNRSGFAGEYDFAYLPRSFDGGSGTGRALINFTTSESAVAFAAAWHLSQRLGAVGGPGGRTAAGRVRVSPAPVQGARANLRKWSAARLAARLTRVTNSDFLPFARAGAWPR